MRARDSACIGKQHAEKERQRHANFDDQRDIPAERSARTQETSLRHQRPYTLLDNDFAGHPWMNLAVVRVLALLFESEGEMIACIERGRVECLGRAGHGVRLVVMIGPCDCCASRDFQSRRIEGKVVDIHSWVVAGRLFGKG